MNGEPIQRVLKLKNVDLGAMHRKPRNVALQGGIGLSDSKGLPPVFVEVLGFQ